MLDLPLALVLPLTGIGALIGRGAAVLASARDGAKRSAGRRRAGSAPVGLQTRCVATTSVVAEDRLPSTPRGRLELGARAGALLPMDLLRRQCRWRSVLALVDCQGAAAADMTRRVHRFRCRAEAALATPEAPDRRLLDVCAAGVTPAWRRCRCARPVSAAAPGTTVAWRPADYLLVTLSMYLDLQRGQGATGWPWAPSRLVPPDWYAFRPRHGSDTKPRWMTRVGPVPVPARPAAALRRPGGLGDCRGTDARHRSNNSVSAAHATHGHAMVATTCTSACGVPGTWFKARLQWKNGRRPRRPA